ncbi:hypothetical protein ACOMHN_049892 [Nucella lapillus]
MDPTDFCQRLLLLVLVVFCLKGPCEGKQMCLSCSFQNSVGSNCLDDPWNWSIGNVRARCPFKCSFRVRRNVEKNEFIYAYRGCTPMGNEEKEGCVEISGIQICYLSCQDQDYCNDWNATDVAVDEDPNAAAQSSPLLRYSLALVVILVFVFIRA